jgi:hypothetical protein
MRATLNGFSALSCRVHLPAWGAWYAECEIDRPEVLRGAVTLVLADLTLRGTVLAGGAWSGRARYRVVGGAGGWGRTVKAASYSNDLGVKLEKIFTDVAAACGETIGPAPAGVAGPLFVRAEGRAALVLEQLAAEQWYVDNASVTRFGRRAARTYTGNATRLRIDQAGGVLELAADQIADLAPGAVVDGFEAVDVEHTLDEGKLRTTVWAAQGGAPTVLSDHFRQIVTTLTARHRYYAPWEYRVVERVSERYNVQPVRVSSGMPTLRNVRVRGGVAGAVGYAAPGSVVLVSFVNGDPARPVITSFDDPESPGFESTLVRLGDADAADNLVRKSDLQTVANSIRTTFNNHTHPTAANGPASMPTVPMSTITATGSPVVKAGA